MATVKRILLLAGEESGLVYARALRRELERVASEAGAEVEFRGYQGEGFETADLAVMGFLPVLRRLFYFLGVRRRMRALIREWRPDAVVGVDYPGLNLQLEAYAKGLGIPAVHLVCPQVWAWHRGRIPKVAASLTRLLCFFPFEPGLFAGTGLDVKFIGHPLADMFREEPPPAPASAAGAKLLALLPGSRAGEVSRNLPRLLAAAELLAADPSVPPFRAVIPAANARARALIERSLAARGPKAAAAVTVQDGGARALLRRADAAAVASGTATLEAALARCPTVLVYAVSLMFEVFVRVAVRGTRYIGLANVVATRAGQPPPMPELLQESFTPAAVAAKLRGYLADGEERRAAVAALDRAMGLLDAGGGGALAKAAREVWSCAAE